MTVRNLLDAAMTWIARMYAIAPASAAAARPPGGLDLDGMRVALMEIDRQAALGPDETVVCYFCGLPRSELHQVDRIDYTIGGPNKRYAPGCRQRVLREAAGV